MNRQQLTPNQRYWGDNFVPRVPVAALTEPERNLFRTLCGIYETGEMSADEYSALWACWYYSTTSGQRVRAAYGPEWYRGLHENQSYISPHEESDSGEIVE